eukprot:4743194-Amphidinium_carterae.2
MFALSCAAPVNCYDSSNTIQPFKYSKVLLLQSARGVPFFWVRVDFAGSLAQFPDTPLCSGGHLKPQLPGHCKPALLQLCWSCSY